VEARESEGYRETKEAEDNSEMLKEVKKNTFTRAAVCTDLVFYMNLTDLTDDDTWQLFYSMIELQNWHLQNFVVYDIHVFIFSACRL